MTVGAGRSGEDALREIGQEQAGVVTLGQLREVGVTRARRRAQLDAERWRAIPQHGIVILGLSPEGRRDLALWWSSVVAAGEPAALGGITALQAYGLQGFDEALVHVWLPKSSRTRELEGVKVHETRRWGETDVLPVGLRRSRPAVAVVQAALWARTSRQAVLATVMPIQQRLVRAEDVAVELDRVRRHAYRSTLRAALADITNGAHSMNELDFASWCRRYGLPEPSRQTVAKGPLGRVYLDVKWRRFGVALEINGIGHLRADQILKDNFRTVDLQLDGEVVIELSVLTLRAAPDEAMARVAAILRARGWRSTEPAPAQRPA